MHIDVYTASLKWKIELTSMSDAMVFVLADEGQPGQVPLNGMHFGLDLIMMWPLLGSESRLQSAISDRKSFSRAGRVYRPPLSTKQRYDYQQTATMIYRSDKIKMELLEERTANQCLYPNNRPTRMSAQMS